METTTTIRKLFSDQDCRFEIPAYQRAYSWEKENALQFIQDLKDATQDYYLGHFLLEQNSEFAKTLFIVDGQQRLTTCIIFFSCLFNVLKKRKLAGEVTSIDIDNDIRHIYLRDLLKKTQKLSTVPDDNNFFVDEIVDRDRGGHPEPTTTSQKRIREARKLFDAALQNAKLAELEKWCSLVENAECTKLHVSDKIKAAQIFAFQNDRGRDLSKLEILKSYFMLQMYLHKQSDEVLKEDLRYLEADISSIYKQVVKVSQKEDDVLLHFWRATTGSRGFNSENFVTEVKAYIVESKVEISERIKTFVAGLARAFQLVEQIENSQNPDVQNLVYLNNLALAYPFLIRAQLHGATQNQLERLARLLENITFRSLIRGGRAAIESRLNSYLTKPADASYVENVISGVISDFRQNDWWIYWRDATLAEYLNGWMYKNPVDNYLLWRYEEFLCAKTDHKIKVAYKDLIRNESIEHIAPQNPPAGESISTGYGRYEDKEIPINGIESGSWLNRVGNLMLLSQSQNSSVGNRPFSEKLLSYRKNTFLIQQQELVNFVSDPFNPVWDKTAIENRHQAILIAAKDIWDFNKI